MASLCRVSFALFTRNSHGKRPGVGHQWPTWSANASRPSR
jgi:hypothetical protein